MIPRIPVESSNVKSVGYENGTLAVEFSNGGVYHYEGVPAWKYNELMAAESVGRYLATEIKGKYPATKQAQAA